MNNNSIGIFDSGVGGITVLKKLKEKLPQENYIYLGDTKNFPYGEKSKEEIIEFTRENIKTLIKEKAKIIVIACGTATSQALDVVKGEFDIPIVGIIEPTVNYISTLGLEKIGVIATTGTIRSGAWERKILEKNPNLKVINKACPLLASIAEEGRATSKESLDAVHDYMEVFKENEVDTIILGCTHYPIYNKIIKNEFDYEVNLINTGEAVANKIEEYLKENNMQNGLCELKQEKILLTKNVIGFQSKVEKILAK